MAVSTNNPGPILAGIFCSGLAPDQDAAYVRVYNPGHDPADLSGLILEWGAVALLFPQGKSVPAESSIYVAWNADAYRRLLTRLPDYSVTKSADVASLAAPHGVASPLQPTGGSVRLLSPAGAVLDAFVWGSSPGLQGWNGPAVAAVGQGIVFQRAIQEETLGADSPGHFIADAGTATAWRQGTDWLQRRIMHIGQSELTYPTLTVPGALTFTCPDSAFKVISEFIDKATTQLDLNLYLFTQQDLADRIIAAVKRKVSVRLLVEGEPYRGMPPNDRDNISRLQGAGVQVRVMHRSADGFKRYRYDHAKYAVIDGHLCLMMSDNWTNTSIPSSPLTGHRGWGVILDSAPMAAHLAHIFESDWNPASPDSVPFDPNSTHLAGELPHGAEPAVTAEPQRALPDPIQPVQIDGPVQVTPFTAPDHALLQTRAICGLIRSAVHTVDVQQDSIPPYWGGFGTGGSVETTPNLFLAEVVAAARRGVRVRVLLDGAYLNSQNPRDNSHTQTWLQELATAEKLSLEARILDVKATGMSIHNKGVIVDGRKVLISSINWSENSPLENREFGLILESAAVAGFFSNAFERDWAGGN